MMQYLITTQYSEMMQYPITTQYSEMMQYLMTTRLCVFIVIFNNFIFWQLKVLGRTARRAMYIEQTCETPILGKDREA
jgi:hypothetical protein